MKDDLEICIWKSMLEQIPLEEIEPYDTNKLPLLLIGGECKLCDGYDVDCIYYKPGTYKKEEEGNEGW